MLSVIEALALLTPYDVDLRKERVGPSGDGGYVFLTELFDAQPVLSYGIADEYDFDVEMADRGHDVYMFDHTIDGGALADKHKRMHFYQEGVAGVSQPDHKVYTVEDHIARHSIKGRDFILKMDVEGAEYSAFEAMSRSTLSRFQQIVLEVHGLNELQSDAYRLKFSRLFEKINKDFTLFHVHANNQDGSNNFTFVSGVPVSNLLELSYVRSDLVTRRTSETLYPTHLDYPSTLKDDKRLWFYPFLPTNIQADEFCAADTRLRLIGEDARRRWVDMHR